MNASTLARGLLYAHVAAVLFAIVGIAVAIPNPQLWAEIPGAASIYAFGIQYAGALHIVLGAAAVFAFGVSVLGARRTLIFFAASTILSLGMELLGTGTGWPFGAYEYTSGLGPKVLGRVPFSIPLSWFYMGLSAYLLADRIVSVTVARAPAWASVALGVWLLTAWDLVLDPAMAHADLPIRFWVWHETGLYMGMPIINFAGWALTGLLFMSVSRVAWGTISLADAPVGFPLAVYGINMAFAIALSANVGLWLPIGMAIGLGLLPAALAFRRSRPTRRPAPAT